MAKLNVEPLATFGDGSQLLVSTQPSGEGRFSCGLYLASPGREGHVDLRVVSNQFEAATCLEAQTIAYSYAQRMYPDRAGLMKKPPYLLWRGPVPMT